MADVLPKPYFAKRLPYPGTIAPAIWYATNVPMKDGRQPVESLGSTVEKEFGYCTEGCPCIATSALVQQVRRTSTNLDVCKHVQGINRGLALKCDVCCLGKCCVETYPRRWAGSMVAPSAQWEERWDWHFGVAC